MNVETGINQAKYPNTLALDSKSLQDAKQNVCKLVPNSEGRADSKAVSNKLRLAVTWDDVKLVKQVHMIIHIAAQFYRFFISCLFNFKRFILLATESIETEAI